MANCWISICVDRRIQRIIGLQNTQFLSVSFRFRTKSLLVKWWPNGFRTPSGWQALMDANAWHKTVARGNMSRGVDQSEAINCPPSSFPIIHKYATYRCTCKNLQITFDQHHVASRSKEIVLALLHSYKYHQMRKMSFFRGWWWWCLEM